MMDFLTQWKTFSLALAPSGREAAMADCLRQALAPHCDDIRTDKLGNLIAKIAPEKPTHRVMLTAPMDECGFIIRNIDNDGRLRLTLLGAYDTRVLSGRRVVTLSGAHGIVSAKPIHVLSADERSKPTPSDRIYVELGAKDKAEAETLTHLGDFGTWEPKFTALKNDFYAGKALGARGACVVLCEAAAQLAEMKRAGKLQAEFDLVFSAKRRIGGRFAAVETAAFTLCPDVVLVIDAAAAADFDKAKETERGCACGAGAVIAPADVKTIYDRALYADATALAAANGIAWQTPGTAAGAGNEAGVLHKSGAGARTLSLGIPTRNLNSGAEIVKKQDVEAALALLSAWIKKENG